MRAVRLLLQPFWFLHILKPGKHRCASTPYPLSFLELFRSRILRDLHGLKIAQGEWINFSVAQVPPDDLAAGYVIYLLGSLAVHIGLNYMRPFENSKMGRPCGT